MKDFKEDIEFLSRPSIDFCLGNGLLVVFLPIQESRVLSIQMWIKTGSIHEGKFLASGISHFVEHMIFKGTERRTYADIFKTAQTQGAKINAYTSFDHTVFTYDGNIDSFNIGLDILSDMIFHSVFPEEEFKKERDVILREIAMCHDDPNDRLSEILFQLAFQQHPYRYPIIGVCEIFKQLSRKDLQWYWQNRYTVNNMVLVVAGNLSQDRVESSVQRYFGSYKPRSLSPIFIPPEPFQLMERTRRVYGDYRIVRGVIAFKIPGLGHKDSTKLQVLAQVLGGYESSVLYQILREEMSLVHAIDASSWMADQQGLFFIQYTCDMGKREEIENLLRQYLAQWAKRSLTKENIDKVYHQTLISELDVRKTVSGQAHHIGWAAVCLGDVNYPQQYLRQLKMLTAESVYPIIGKYFNQKICTRVSLEPIEAQPKKMVRKLVEFSKSAGIEQLDVNGVRIIYQNSYDFPKTHMEVLFLAGALYEPKHQRGITRLLATLLTKDTQKQSASEIAKVIESVGGQMNGFSGTHHLGISLEVFFKDTPLACQLLQNALTQPIFLQKTFETEKEAQLAEWKAMQDDIFYVGFQKLRQQFFRHHPYCIGQIGNENSLSALTAANCQNFFEKTICVDNCILSVVSSLPKNEVVSLVAPTCFALSKAPFRQVDERVVSSKKISRVELELNKSQTMVFQAYPIAGYAHEDFLVGEFLEELFNGLASNFVEEVREKRGLAYTVGATRLLGLKIGMFCLFAGTENFQTQAVEQEMHRAVARILDRKLSSQEFETCRTCLKVNYQLRLQSIGQKAFHFGHHVLLNHSIDRLLNYEEKIDAVKQSDFLDRCQNYLSSHQRITLVLKPN